MKIDSQFLEIQDCRLTHLALCYLAPAETIEQWENPLYLGPTTEIEVSTRDPRIMMLPVRTSAFSIRDSMELTIGIRKGSLAYETPHYHLHSSPYSENRSVIYVPGGVIVRFEDMPRKWRIGDVPHFNSREFVRTRFETYISFLKEEKFEII